VSGLPPGALAGLWAPVAALGFLARRPGLWWLAAAPVAINLALFVLFFWFAYSRFTQWVASLMPGGEGWWWQALVYVLILLAVLFLLMVQIYLFAVVGRIVAAPFLEALTRRVEALAAPGSKPLTEISFWRSVGRAVVQESKRVLLYLAIMAALLIFNLLPGLGSLIYGVLAWAVTAWFLAGEFLDYPLERRGWSFAAKLGYVFRLRLTSLAFGAAVFVLGLAPVVNLALLPLAAVGGTLLFLERPPPQ